MVCRSISLDELKRAYDVPSFVQLACRYNSHITVKNNVAAFDAKSIMGMMSLDPREGGLKIITEGDDEIEALDALTAFLLN